MKLLFQSRIIFVATTSQTKLSYQHPWNTDISTTDYQHWRNAFSGCIYHPELRWPGNRLPQHGNSTVVWSVYMQYWKFENRLNIFVKYMYNTNHVVYELFTVSNFKIWCNAKLMHFPVQIYVLITWLVDVVVFKNAYFVSDVFYCAWLVDYLSISAYIFCLQMILFLWY